MLKMYAAFVENTIHPMLDRVADILVVAEQKGLPVDKESISELVEKLFLGHIISLIIKCITAVIITAIVGYIVVQIY